MQKEPTKSPEYTRNDARRYAINGPIFDGEYDYYNQPLPDAEAKKFKAEIKRDHRDALKVAKIAKRMVRQVSEMVKNGVYLEPTRTFLLEDLAGPLNDSLGAELSGTDINAKANVHQRWDGSIGDPGIKNFIELTEVDGNHISPTPESKPSRFDSLVSTHTRLKADKNRS